MNSFSSFESWLFLSTKDRISNSIATFSEIEYKLKKNLMENSVKIFLDDTRVPYDVFKNTIVQIYESNEDWIIVRNLTDFKKVFEQSAAIDLVSFDHDLELSHYKEENQFNIQYGQDVFNTGLDAAKWMIEFLKERQQTKPLCLVHSQNDEGKRNIANLLKKNKFSVKSINNNLK